MTMGCHDFPEDALTYDRLANYVFNLDGGKSLAWIIIRRQHYCCNSRESISTTSSTVDQEIRGHDNSIFFVMNAVGNDMEVATDEALLARSLLVRINESPNRECPTVPNNRTRHPCCAALSSRPHPTRSAPSHPSTTTPAASAPLDNKPKKTFKFGISYLHTDRIF